MGDPSDDDVPTMTSSADLRPDEDGAGADADDRTLQKPPDAVATKASAAVPRPASGLSAVSSDKLPPPPAHPLRPRLPSSPSSPSSTATGPVTPAMRPRPAPMSAKAEAAKMDVASLQPAEKDPAKSDSKSDVRTVNSTRGPDEEIEGPPTLESEPPPSEPATSPKAPSMIAPSTSASPSPSSPAPTPPMPRVPSAPMTAKVPSAPATPKSPSAPPPVPKPRPRPSRPDALAAIEPDPTDDSITATAPRVPAPIIPLSAPRSVEIRTLDDDAGDETEVKTLAGDFSDLVRSAQERAEADTGEDDTDDSITAQAPVHPAAPPGATPPPAVIRIGEKSLMPRSTGALPTDRQGPYNPDEEDSVTARSLTLGADFADESVTTRSPNTSGIASLPAPIDGETEGTTKRVRKKPSPLDPNPTEADEKDDSVTAAAPGHLTNMLRVIASPSEADKREAGDVDDMQAHTQVMLNAPVKPSSESGLRVASEGPNGLGGERASLGALAAPPRDIHHSAPMRVPMASDPSLMGPSPSDRISRAPFPPMPMPPEMDRRPPYALLVGVVAAISIAIPVILYVVLSSSGADAAPRVTTQPSPDPVGVTGARPKASKPAPTGAPSGQRPSGGTNGRPSPFRR